MTEQEEFEKWQKNKAYLHDGEQHAFCAGWQAALASREPMTEVEIFDCSNGRPLREWQPDDALAFARAVEAHHNIGVKP